MCDLCRAVEKANREADAPKPSGRRTVKGEPYPWTSPPINTALPAWLRRRDSARQRLAEFGLEVNFDEIALMFPSLAWAAAFALDAVREENVKVFNSAEDIVTVAPIPSVYEVDYIFLETGTPLRVECMAKGIGFSPLHDAIMANHYSQDGSPIAVHLSFKVKDEEHYLAAKRILRNNDGVLVQECDSEYGEFSYWNFEGMDGLYIKPRYNRRDAEESEEPMLYEDVPVAPPANDQTGMPTTGSSIRGLFNK